MALMVWFGIGDLHRDNVALGYDESNRLIFCPLDIEMIFDDLHLVSQTILIPPHELQKEKAGLHLARKLLRAVAPDEYIFELISNFVEMVRELDRQEQDILGRFVNCKEFLRSPIRVIPRATQEYRDHLMSGATPSEIPYFKSEQEQLMRNDIPYFFRFADSDKVLYFSTAEDMAESDLSGKLSLFNIAQARVAKNGAFSPFANRPLLFKAGLLQILKYFLEGEEFFDAEKDGIYISVDRESIRLNFKGEFKIQCARF
jgi:hypothetical protein